MMNEAIQDFFGPAIYSYTRAQALQDGSLIDVSTAARDAGVRVPVALSRAVWTNCVEWSDDVEDVKSSTTGEDEDGRLWDVVYMLARACRSARSSDGKPLRELSYRLLRVPPTGRGVQARPVTLKAVLGPDDEGAMVITVLMPDES